MLLPDMTAGNKEKDSYSFGQRVAEHISSEWSSGFRAAEKARMRELNSHMQGTVDASHLKKLFSPRADVSSIGVNWKYSSEIPKFINAIVEGFSYDKYRTTVKGVDLHSQKKRSQFKREKLKAMATQHEAKAVSEIMGMDFTHKGFLPQSEEELNLYMELEYKPSTEIAPELGIQKVYEINDWKEIFNNVASDLALHGIGVTKVRENSEIAVDFGYVDPSNFIYSRDTEKTRDRRGSYYFGEARLLTISEVERIAKGRLTTDEIKQICSMSGNIHTSFDDMTGSEMQESVEAISFCFKANRYEMKKKKFNKYGTYKYLDKEDYWSPPQNMRSEILRVPYEVWYEGIYIPGANALIEYKLMDNIMRDPSNARKAIPPYIMYKLNSESIGNRIVDISDDIYVVLVKLRQFVIKMRPKGYAIDIDGLGSLTMPDGTTLDPIQQVKIMNEDGNLLYSGSSLIDGGMQARPPIYNLPDAAGRELSELASTYSMLVQRLHDITGINPQAVGAAPPSRTSRGVYQGTLDSSQRVVNNIFNGLLSIQQRTGEAIISRLQSAATFKETRPIVENLLGEFTTDMIREIASIDKYQYVLTVDSSPTDLDRQMLSEDISIAMQTGVVSITDKIDIESIDNLKLARQMIKIRQKKNLENAERKQREAYEHEQKIREIEGQQKRETLEFETTLKTQVAMAEAEIEAKLLAYKDSSIMKQISLKGQWQMAIEKAKAGIKSDIDFGKEDRKDNRIKLQADVKEINQ